jgi:hypothetical protein
MAFAIATPSPAPDISKELSDFAAASKLAPPPHLAEIPATAGTLTAPMVINGDYIEVPDGEGNEGTGRVHFMVKATAATTVSLSCEIKTPTGADDSFYVWFDDNFDDKYQWDTGQISSFTWKTVSKSFALSAGDHILHIGNREDGAKLRKVKIINGSAIIGLSVESDGCTGNDCSTSTSCPQGTRIFQCRNVGNAVDGVYVTDDLDCTARGANDNQVKAEAMCVGHDNFHHNMSVSVSGSVYEDEVTLKSKCGLGQSAVSCNCHSPWGTCGDVVAFEPNADGICSKAIGVSASHRRRGVDNGAGAKIYSLCKSTLDYPTDLQIEAWGIVFDMYNDSARDWTLRSRLESGDGCIKNLDYDFTNQQVKKYLSDQDHRDYETAHKLTFPGTPLPKGIATGTESFVEYQNPKGGLCMLNEHGFTTDRTWHKFTPGMNPPACKHGDDAKGAVQTYIYYNIKKVTVCNTPPGGQKECRSRKKCTVTKVLVSVCHTSYNAEMTYEPHFDPTLTQAGRDWARKVGNEAITALCSFK